MQQKPFQWGLFYYGILYHILKLYSLEKSGLVFPYLPHVKVEHRTLPKITNCALRVTIFCLNIPRGSVNIALGKLH